MFADIDRSVAAGDLYVEGNDLEKLIGRAPTSLADAVAAAHARPQG
jgi:NAD(P)H dehydrogenase (quinone)